MGCSSSTDLTFDFERDLELLLLSLAGFLVVCLRVEPSGRGALATEVAATAGEALLCTLTEGESVWAGRGEDVCGRGSLVTEVVGVLLAIL